MDKLTTVFLFCVFSLSVFPLFAQQDDSSTTLDNCGFEYTFAAPPQRAITMNQAATEVMLALGLQEFMIGTAYLDDQILPQYEEAYTEIPVLAAEYPSQEVVLDAEPDFVYGSFFSAFGEDAAGSREQLAGFGIGSYLSPMACEDRSLRPQTLTFDDIFGEIRDIGRIFGVEDRAEAYIEELQAELDAILEKIDPDADPIPLFWYDSGVDEVYTGACCGAPALIMQSAGAENIFADVPGSWGTVGWESVVERDPAVLVLIHASWDTAEDKIDLLTSNPAYSSIRAVQAENWLVLDFSYTVPGIRNVEAVKQLAAFLHPE